jgi:hypothetical protein
MVLAGNEVQRIEEFIGELVRELQFNRFEPLLLEAGSRGTGIIRKPRVRGTSNFESRHQATASGDCNRLRKLVVCIL